MFKAYITSTTLGRKSNREVHSVLSQHRVF